MFQTIYSADKLISHTPSLASSNQAQASDASLDFVLEDRLDWVDSQWLRSIYNQGFETIFGSWMGKYSNPFVYV